MTAFRSSARARSGRSGDGGRIGAGGDGRLDGGCIHTRCLGSGRVEYVHVQHGLGIPAQIHMRAIHELDIHGGKITGLNHVIGVHLVANLQYPHNTFGRSR